MIDLNIESQVEGVVKNDVQVKEVVEDDEQVEGSEGQLQSNLNIGIIIFLNNFISWDDIYLV